MTHAMRRSTFSVPYPEVYLNFIAFISTFVDMNLASILRLNCAVSMNYEHLIILKTLCTIGILGLFLFVALSARVLLKHDARQRRRVTRFCVTSALTLCFLVYPNLTSNLFRWFKCIPGGNGEMLLLADMSVVRALFQFLVFHRAYVFTKNLDKCIARISMSFQC